MSFKNQKVCICFFIRIGKETNLNQSLENLYNKNSIKLYFVELVKTWKLKSNKFVVKNFLEANKWFFFLNWNVCKFNIDFLTSESSEIKRLQLVLNSQKDFLWLLWLSKAQHFNRISYKSSENKLIFYRLLKTEKQFMIIEIESFESSNEHVLFESSKKVQKNN